MTIAKVQTSFQSAAIYRCTRKATREVFYRAKSDATGTYHTVTLNHLLGVWSCDCGQAECECLAAVNQVLDIRRARLAAAMSSETSAIVAKITHAKKPRPTATPRQYESWGDETDTLDNPAPLYSVLTAEATRRMNAPLNGDAGFQFFR